MTEKIARRIFSHLRGAPGPAPRRVQGKALKLTWFRGGVKMLWD